jgi:hypothetical protein
MNLVFDDSTGVLIGDGNIETFPFLIVSPLHHARSIANFIASGNFQVVVQFGKIPLSVRDDSSPLYLRANGLNGAQRLNGLNVLTN